ncbi:restriction endonuclease subunit S [Faecalibacterium prausnitzii]|uniref:Type I restriction enzyme specificity protein MG438 n=1 Tax=Faecalibacterium prausnitzii TaxID=853 RepID=A0A173RNB8_9FIRM|nr:restriction endonuclease subunit S [Faecalibacterium prausnitzii]CUM79463.1 Type I restriction enzyme specificity protein MG438 [Faecalibacterium prausnitzii]
MKSNKIRLGEQCVVTSSKRFHLSERITQGVPFYCSKEIIKKFNGEDVTECDYISEDLYKKVSNEFGVPKENDLLITTRGTIGIPYLYKRTDRFYFADGNLTWIKDFDSNLYSKFLYYWFQSYEGRKKFEALAKGTAQKAVPISGIKTLEIELPSLKDQKRIVDILSAYDDLIENNQKQIKLLEEAAQRLYKEWFVDLRFPGHENTKIVDGVPEGWNEKTLSQVANVIMGQSPKSEFYNSEKKGLPFHQGVGSYGVRFVMDDIYSTSYTRIAEPNSILFSVRAPVGRLNITKNKVVIGRGLAAINQADGCQSYLYYLLKNKFFKDNIVGNGSIFASVSKDELLNQKFLIPERNLMMQFEKIVSQMDKQIENLDSKNKKLIEARDRLLPKLMSGEVEV